MPIYRASDPNLRQNFSRLGEAIYPSSGASTGANAVLARERARKVGIESARLAREEQGVANLASYYEGLGSQEGNANQLAALMIRAGQEGSTPWEFNAGYAGALPAGTVAPGRQAGLQVSSGVQPYSGTQVGFEAGEAGEMARNAATIEGAGERNAATIAAANARAAADRAQRLDIADLDRASREQIAADKLRAETGEASPSQTIFPGKGLEAATQRLFLDVNQKIQNGVPLTQPEEIAYRQRFHDTYMQPSYREVTLADGSKRLELGPPPPIPPGMFNPFTNAPQPTVGTVATPAIEETTLVAEGPEGTEVATETQGGMVTREAPDAVRQAGAEEARQINLTQQWMAGVNDVFTFFGYNPATGELAEGGYEPGVGHAFRESIRETGPMGEYASNVMGVTPESDQDFQTYNRTAMKFVEPLLRLRSGAATPELEVRRYKNYMPRPGDTRTTIRDKMGDLHQLQQGAMKFAELRGLPVEELYGMLSGDSRDPAVVDRVNSLSREFQAFMQANPDAGASTAGGVPDDATAVQWAREALGVGAQP